MQNPDPTTDGAPFLRFVEQNLAQYFWHIVIFVLLAFIFAVCFKKVSQWF